MVAGLAVPGNGAHGPLVLVNEDLPMLGSERARLLAALDLLQNWVSWLFCEIGENTVDGKKSG